MEELARVFEGMTEQLSDISLKLDKLDDISDQLGEISNKLSNIDGIYGIDDIIDKLDSASSEISTNITGPMGYHLGDINDAINNIG